MGNKKTVVAFTIADDQPNNQKMLKNFQNSLRKFHSEEELPLIVIDQKRLDTIPDPQKFYRMTPMIARDLIREYDTVIKFDCDQIVMGKLDHLWKNYPHDIHYVLNGNPKEPAISVLDIHPAEYANCGLVVMHSPIFINHWWKLCCSPHFNNFQFREQDLMNILISYGNYDVDCLDFSDKWHGLVAKGWEANMVLKGNSMVVLEKRGEMWPMDKDKQIVLYHFAGGNDPNKGNYKIHFTEELVKHIDWLVSDGK